MVADSIPIRLSPWPGEALDSYLETYAELLHARIGDLFDLAGIPAHSGRSAKGRNNLKPWMFAPDPAEVEALSLLTGLSAGRMIEMTLARYAGTGLVAFNPESIQAVQSGRWWRQRLTSKFCPRCLAESGGRWLLAWRLPWSFACTRHQVLLLDVCPACRRPHRRTRNQPPRPGDLCWIAGLSSPPPQSRRGTLSCAQDLAEVDAVPLPVGGRVLHAQHHVDAIIAALVKARGDAVDLTGPQGELDDVHAVARAALSALRTSATCPATVTAALAELGVDPDRPEPAEGDDAAMAALTHPASGIYRQHAAVIAFGTAVADLMVCGRHDDPDPTIPAWLVEAAFPQINQAGPAMLLKRWATASQPLQAAVLKQLGPRLQAIDQLRYNTATPTPGRPTARTGTARAAATPTLFWPGWALRLMPPEGFVALPYRVVLSVLLLIAGTEDTSCGHAQHLLGLPPTDVAKFSAVTQRLRRQGILSDVLSALGQLAHHLDTYGAPIDYARRRRLRRFTHARLDIDA